MVRRFTRAYQVESPSPLNKERMQPRVENNPIVETEKLCGKCLRKAFEAIEEEPSLRLVMGPPGQKGDTAHFWTIRLDGSVYDPTPEAVTSEYEYEGRVVDPKSVKKELRLARKINATLEYEFGLMDIVTGEWHTFKRLQDALAMAKTAMGWKDDKVQEAIYIREPGQTDDDWQQMIEVFGELDLKDILEQVPGYKRPPMPKGKWSNELRRMIDKMKQPEPRKPWEDDPEGWKREGKVRSFNIVTAAHWTPKELAILKQVYRNARDKGIPHHLIYKRLSDFLPRSHRGIKQKLESLYKQDEELSSYKFESWNRDRIIKELEDLYKNGESVARKSLPPKLEYQITNHSLPKAITRGFEVFFDSFDHAVAEAITHVGCERDLDGMLLPDRLVECPEDAWYYYRNNEKKNNPWTKREIIRLFKKAHEKGLPLTKSFFTSHPQVYKPLIGVSRSLDGLRKSVDRLGFMWGDLVIEAVPDYESWYNENGKPKNSMGELRVIRFLDLQGIPYRPSTRQDKIAVTEPEILEAGYRNFVPDIFIQDEDGNDIGIVEIYGAIADSHAAEGELQQKYREKIEAKEKVYNSLPLSYIAIHDNSLYGCDLSDDRLGDKFAIFIKPVESSIDEP